MTIAKERKLLATRVAATAREFDSSRPSWCGEIDIILLDIGSLEHCIAAQLAGKVSAKEQKFLVGLEKLHIAQYAAHLHGLNVDPFLTMNPYDQLEELGELWSAEIGVRVLADEVGKRVTRKKESESAGRRLAARRDHRIVEQTVLA